MPRFPENVLWLSFSNNLIKIQWVKNKINIIRCSFIVCEYRSGEWTYTMYAYRRILKFDMWCPPPNSPPSFLRQGHLLLLYPVHGVSQTSWTVSFIYLAVILGWEFRLGTPSIDYFFNVVCGIDPQVPVLCTRWVTSWLNHTTGSCFAKRWE